MKKATVGIVLFNPEVETINKNIELLKSAEYAKDANGYQLDQ